MIFKSSILGAISALSLTAAGATMVSSFTTETATKSHLELYESNKKDELQKQDQKIYWYGGNGKDDFEVQNDFSTTTDIEKYFYWEVNLGKLDILKGYSNWVGLDENNNSETWTSWGNTRYTGTAWKSVSGTSILNIDLNKWGSVDDGAIYMNAKIKLLFTEQWSFLAWFKSEQWVGVSYFQRSNYYYLSIFGYQKGHTKASMSGGRIFMNLGNGIKFIG